MILILYKGDQVMKNQLEKIEQRIERLEPGKVVRLGDITKNIKGQKNEITKATIMLLQKYGIEYQ